MDIFYRRGSAWTGTGLDRIVPAGHQSTGPNKTWRKIIFTLWMIKFGFWISETYSISVFRLKICLTRSLLNLNGNETFLKWTLTGTKIGQFDWWRKGPKRWGIICARLIIEIDWSEITNLIFIDSNQVHFLTVPDKIGTFLPAFRYWCQTKTKDCYQRF